MLCIFIGGTAYDLTCAVQTWAVLGSPVPLKDVGGASSFPLQGRWFPIFEGVPAPWQQGDTCHWWAERSLCEGAFLCGPPRSRGELQCWTLLLGNPGRVARVISQGDAGRSAFCDCEQWDKGAAPRFQGASLPYTSWPGAPLASLA